MKLFDIVSQIFKPAVELVDELHTSEEERLVQKAKILDAQVVAIDAVLAFEKETFEAQADIVKAEAQSEHWLAAVWRPIVMLSFCGLAIGDSLGLLASPLAPEAWLLLQIGLGGYMVGRSGEKVAKSIIQAKVTGK